MRKTLWLLALLGVVGVGIANAAPGDELKMTVEVIMEHQEELVFGTLGLSPEEEAAFRPLYDAYREDHDKVLANRVALIREYMEHRQDISDAKAAELIDKLFAVQALDLSTRQEHAEKMLAVLPAAKVLRFLQIENKLWSLISLRLAETIPLAG